MNKNAVQQKTGINPGNMEWMHGEAVRQQVPAAGWRVTLDELQIQDDVQVVKKGKSWRLVAFVNVGDAGIQLEELLNGKAAMASHVLQFVFNGFTVFRWPVHFMRLEQRQLIKYI